jgi:hypothetical protein
MPKQKSDTPPKKKFKTRVHFVGAKGAHIDAVVTKVNDEATGDLELSLFPPGGQNTTVKNALPDPTGKTEGTWHDIEEN